jgi:hypothetical protein
MVVTNEGIMYAMIYDYENSAVSGVTIKVNGKELVKSDMQGRFILDFKKGGEYEIELIKKGYEKVVQKFDYNPMEVLYFKMITAAQLVNLAEESLDRFDCEEAEIFLSRAYSMEPYRADIIYLTSVTLYLQGKYYEAKDRIKELKEKNYANKYIALLEEQIEENLKK